MCPLMSGRRCRGADVLVRTYVQAKEPLGQLFQDGSASRAMFFNYTHTMVSRYATTDTVFMWEVHSARGTVVALPHSSSRR